MSEYVHPKGRDCARTDEVLENYRMRAIRFEMGFLEMLGALTGDERAVMETAYADIRKGLAPDTPTGL